MTVARYFAWIGYFACFGAALALLASVIGGLPYFDSIPLRPVGGALLVGMFVPWFSMFWAANRNAKRNAREGQSKRLGGNNGPSEWWGLARHCPRVFLIGAVCLVAAAVVSGVSAKDERKSADGTTQGGEGEPDTSMLGIFFGITIAPLLGAARLEEQAINSAAIKDS